MSSGIRLRKYNIFRLQNIEDVRKQLHVEEKSSSPSSSSSSASLTPISSPKTSGSSETSIPVSNDEPPQDSSFSSSVLPLDQPSVDPEVPVVPQLEDNPKPTLQKCLNVFDLIGIGVGTIIGAGIFVLTGVAARRVAGPAISLSYLFSGIACMFSGLCYSEFAARVPVSGSAYTYAYCTVGEFVAWIIGWNLVLEYTIGAATVARAWSGYLSEFLEGIGLQLPEVLYSIKLWIFVLDPLALASIIVLTILLCVGIKESSWLNSLIVAFTIVIIVFIIGCGFYLGTIDNWLPLSENFLPYGFKSIFAGSATIFFAYVGFDAVATAAEEVKNPQRDLPLGIIGSLSISAVLYVLVSAALTFMVPYNQINVNSPMAAAFADTECNGNQYGWKWGQLLVSVGAFAALTTSILGNLLSQPRIFFSMARDGLLPEWFARIHSKFRTPLNSTVVAGAFAGLLAFFLDIETLSEMVSIGTLLAFMIVCCAVLTVRLSTPEEPILVVVLITFIIPLALTSFLMVRFEFYWVFFVIAAGLSLIPAALLFLLKPAPLPESFATPFVPLVPLLGIFLNLFLMSNLSLMTWIRLVVWLVIGVLIYFTYSVHHSKLNVHDSSDAEVRDTSKSVDQKTAVDQDCDSISELPKEVDGSYENMQSSRVLCVSSNDERDEGLGTFSVEE